MAHKGVMVCDAAANRVIVSDVSVADRVTAEVHSDEEEEAAEVKAAVHRAEEGYVNDDGEYMREYSSVMP